jgi:HAD superfamily hydrolase (TIGR01549 family)
MPLRAVIFDLDDTLLDSSALRADREAGNWREVLSRLDEVSRFEVADGEPQVTELPRMAREKGLAVGVLTQSPRAYATELLRAHGINVEAMVSGSDEYPRKPDPTGLNALLAELGVEAADALLVGDSVVDFQAAAAAGALSAGVAWTATAPSEWRHSWPDVAVSRPSRLLELLGGENGLGAWGEVIAAGGDPRPHWGSLMRLGGGVYGLGRYFPTADTRYPAHALSHLVLDAKSDLAPGEEVAAIFGTLAEKLTHGPIPQLVLSVPPESDGYDRFAPARAALAEVWGARDGGGLLTMSYTVEEYKHLAREERPGRNNDRFRCAPLEGERVLLIDDVLTSGGQSEACRVAIAAARGGLVTVLVLSVTQDKLTEACPLCGANLRTFTRHRDGREFLGCGAWWQTRCPYTRDIEP